MSLDRATLKAFLATVHPYDGLAEPVIEALLPAWRPCPFAAGQSVYALDEPLEGLFLIHSGAVAVTDRNGVQISALGPRNSFGERGLLRDGHAVTAARATEDSLLLVLQKDAFLRLVETQPTVARFFDRRRAARPASRDLTTSRVETLMATSPLTCGPATTVQEAAALMQARHVSSLCVTEGDTLTGIVTLRDLSGKVVAGGLPLDTPVARVMTAAPETLPPSAIGSDVLHMMLERRIGHVPITAGGRLVGMVTQTDLTRYQAMSSADLVAGIADAPDAAAMARVTARIPQLLVQLVAAGNRHDVVTRLVTDIADTATRRLLMLTERDLGPAPVPYLWAACGSQGRQEQTGITDQDNVLILDDAYTEDMRPWFTALAQRVTEGLNACGYVFCPGKMMASTPRWCQPLATWRGYFQGWITRPSPEAQMLSSVMFDLRPIGGSPALLQDLQHETLEMASRNSIFVAHMLANSLKHTPPLGLLRGLATIRSGEHRNHIDLKHSGIVPVVDLARLYALQGRLGPVNTRARLEAAIADGLLSCTGGQDLLHAYDLIAETRLAHQARQIKAGEPPDNYLAPARLADFERSHLRDAFVVVKSLQSALGHGKGMLS
ncbi:DUF294 nucleotidyltransferase-like domain-containing protein [Sagittula salina]|uniref:CBS domain-containing protein n=1 Tax=Sagittula salina TaxID=2820268 RepID=A0A940MUC5_9RHOB|nr:DUF294 nucleotidyltransferase-like domain-containing protein [Sagittula salina]MBP0484107.1 CBS domain-containing protein [Sagittula salina]